jgi:hypothetical protein
MTPQEVLSVAKQGNPQAIAALMNRTLQPQGITAKAKLTDGCLHVMLESVTVPNKAALVPYVTKGLRGLNIEAIKRLVVYGRIPGDDAPAWSDQVKMGAPEIISSMVTETKSVEPGTPTEVLELKEKPQEKPNKKLQAGLTSLGVFLILLWLVGSCLGLYDTCESATKAWRQDMAFLGTLLEKNPEDGLENGNVQAQMESIKEAEAKKYKLCK